MGRVIMGAKKACCQQNLRKFSEAIKLGDKVYNMLKNGASLTSLMQVCPQIVHKY